jgi:hypothetical protein
VNIDQNDTKIYLLYREEREVVDLKKHLRTVSGIIKKPIPMAGHTPSDIFNLIIDVKNMRG